MEARPCRVQRANRKTRNRCSARRIRVCRESPDRPVFEEIRESLRDILAGRVAPEDRRAMMHAMKETLVRAKMGVEDLRQGLSNTRVRLGTEKKELETVQRRKQLAANINDAETVAIAERYEKQLAEKVDVLERKLAVQEAELMIVEQEVASMMVEMKAANAGLGSVPPASSAADPLAADDDDPQAEIDGLARARRRNATDADAEARLAELKRRMGK